MMVAEENIIRLNVFLSVIHHILNRMNNIGIVLYFFADNHLIRNCEWWDKRKTTGDFFIPVFIVLNLGCEIKDIFVD